MPKLVNHYGSRCLVIGRRDTVKIINSSPSVLIGIHQYIDLVVMGIGCHITYRLHIRSGHITLDTKGIER